MILVLVEPAAAADAAAGTGTDLISLETLAFARGLAAGGAAGAGGADAPAGAAAPAGAGGAAVPAGAGEVEALVVGPYPAAMPAELGAYGVAEIHHADDPRLERYAAAAWAAALVDTIADRHPDVVVVPGTPRGGEVLAHAAARMGAVMAANCVRAEARADGGLLVARQVMGGAVLEEVQLHPGGGEPALLTMAGHAVEPEPATVPTSPAVHAVTLTLTEADFIGQVQAVEPVQAGGAELSQARVVVGAGRGVGGADRFGDLLELTELLGGALGVSRVVTSLGWRPHHEQVGQTGSRISPDVYIACGISGAIQHWSGCSSAKTIIAVNTDPDAPMVAKADYAVIGDLHEVVPAVTAELRRRLG